MTAVPFVGGTGVVSGTGLLSCVPTPHGLVGNASGTIAVTWYDGSDQVAGQSTISWSLTISGVLVVVQATITSGDLAGSTVLFEVVVTGFNGTCNILGPVVAIGFAGAAEVLQL